MVRGIVLAAVAALIATERAAAFPDRVPSFERVAAAGHPLKISSISAIDQVCHSLGPITVGIVDAPHNGSITVEQGRDFPNFSALNTRSRCNTHKVPATRVFYTPASGYAGDDAFVIEYVGPLGEVGRARYHISVR